MHHTGRRQLKSTLITFEGILKVVVTLLFFMLTGNAFSQDVIYTVKGPEIKCKVVNIKGDSVIYNEKIDASSFTKSINKKEVVKIKYANGVEDVLMSSVIKAEPGIAEKPTAVTTPSPVTTSSNAAVVSAAASSPATTVKPAQSIDPKPAAQAAAETMTAILEAWKRKYNAPPIELF